MDARVPGARLVVGSPEGRGYTRPVSIRDQSPWVVLCETEQRRWGGDMRRALIFGELARATGALEAQGWGHRAVRQAVRAVAGPPFPWRRRPALASTEFLSEGGTEQARRSTRPVILDVHDHPIFQFEAFRRPIEPSLRVALEDKLRRNLATFPLYSAPSKSFAALAGLDPSRTIVAPNGSDTGHVTPRPVPVDPAIGMISGAAEGRGIEALVEAARRLRLGEPTLTLYLWLVAGDETGEAYLSTVRAAVDADPWIVIRSLDHDDVPEALGRATVLVVPHPAHPYMDVAVPVKLIDSMAAGRPVVVTPRTETRRIIEASEGGIVADADGPEALAAAIGPLLKDRPLAARLGANARAAAEAEYDWGVIGRRLAEAVLARSSDRPASG